MFTGMYHCAVTTSEDKTLAQRISTLDTDLSLRVIVKATEGQDEV